MTTWGNLRKRARQEGENENGKECCRKRTRSWIYHSRLCTLASLPTETKRCLLRRGGSPGDTAVVHSKREEATGREGLNVESGKTQTTKWEEAMWFYTSERVNDWTLHVICMIEDSNAAYKRIHSLYCCTGSIERSSTIMPAARRQP